GRRGCARGAGRPPAGPRRAGLRAAVEHRHDHGGGPRAAGMAVVTTRRRGSAAAAAAAVPRSRLLLLAGGGVALLLGLWSGLARAGIHDPIGPVSAHGVIMVLGFLGTLIALERAVAFGAAWAF